jgi:hypothetical protein
MPTFFSFFFKKGAPEAAAEAFRWHALRVHVPIKGNLRYKKKGKNRQQKDASPLPQALVQYAASKMSS